MKKSETDLFASLGITSKPATPRAASLFGGSLFPSEQAPSDEAPSSSPAPQHKYEWPPRQPQATSKSATTAPSSSSASASADADGPLVEDPLSKASDEPPEPAAVASASTVQPVGFGSASVAPPSWQLPAHTTLNRGETMQHRPAPAQLVLPAQHGPSTALRPGTLFLSSLRMIWEPSASRRRNEDDGPEAPVVHVHLNSIEKLRKLKLGVAAADGTAVVEVVQKYNARPSLRLVLTTSECARVQEYLRVHIGIPSHQNDVRANIPRSYAVLHAASIAAEGGQREAFSSAFKGWGAFDPEREFHRQGLNNPLSHWRVSTLNQSYKLCTTYPALLVVPRCISDDDLQRAAAFRSGRRVPVLCWKDPFGVASITRSSQPMVGVAKARSKQDEELLQAIVDTNPLNDRLQIIDCRPRVNAEVNAAKGKGYEHQAQYINSKLTFMSIENIHVMRQSLRHFLALLAPRNLSNTKEDDDFFKDVDKSGWFEHLRKLLRTSCLVVQMISVDGASVLVHCSDGWDRTAQITSLAQLMLDAHFRTIKGFQRLIIKEWLSFGHQFALRLGLPAPLEKHSAHHAPSDDELSPVFLQFIECVWQLSQQLPHAFEFNGRYLVTLLHHVLSCEHGTFLCNCERQRVELGLETSTTSVWDALDSDEFLNPEYVPDPQILHPNLASGALRPWTAYYCRGSAVLAEDPLTLLERRCTSLTRENAQLREELQRLREMRLPENGAGQQTLLAHDSGDVAPAASPVPANDQNAANAVAVAVEADEELEEEVFENVRASFGVVEMDGRDSPGSPEPEP